MTIIKNLFIAVAIFISIFLLYDMLDRQFSHKPTVNVENVKAYELPLESAKAGCNTGQCSLVKRSGLQ